MTMLADDATAAAVLDAMPCYPVPPFGRSPVIEALRASRIGHGLAIGHDGVMLILRRPWLALDVPIASPHRGLCSLWQHRSIAGRSTLRPHTPALFRADIGISEGSPAE